MKSWVMIAIAALVLGLTACKQQGAQEGAGTAGGQTTEESGEQK